MALWTGLLMVINLDNPSGQQTWLIIWVLSVFATMSLVGTIIFRKMPLDTAHSALMYFLVGLKAVGITAVLYLMLILLIFAAPLLVADLLPHFSAIIVASAGIVLIGTMRHPVRRTITIATVGLWAMIVVMGSYWVWTIDNGLDMYVDEERSAAESAYGVERYTYCKYEPTEYRIAKDDKDRFVMIPYTFWRLPGRTCKHYVHWNRIGY